MSTYASSSKSSQKSSVLPVRSKAAKTESTPAAAQETAKTENSPEMEATTEKPWGAIAANVTQTSAGETLRGRNGSVVQRKMILGEVGDRYEQEADRVASQVIQQINSPGFQKKQKDSQPESERHAPTLQLQAIRPTLQLKSESSGETVSPAIESAITRARGGGEPLEPRLRKSLGLAMGADFSGVRVHTDALSDQLARSVSAKAFTTGQDIFFKKGEYQTGNRAGQELISHELTHVMQQRGEVQRLKGGKADVTARLRDEIATPNIQLYTEEEAKALINEKYSEWESWYHELGEPSLKTIAAKEGQDLKQYLAGKTKADFEGMIKALHKDPSDEAAYSGTWWERLFNKTLIKSKDYPPNQLVRGTNILVPPQSQELNALQNFIDDYQRGRLYWYRGLGTNHFSYKQLRETGVFGSEGTEDKPTFTMAENVKTRWLPGVNVADTANGVASRIDREDKASRYWSELIDVPIGVTIKYNIKPPMHTAYLNAGEQLVRGPIKVEEVETVVLLGPNGISYRLTNGRVSDLPPEAPYRETEDSPKTRTWVNEITRWVEAHE